MTQLTNILENKSISNEIVQISHIKGESVFMTDPEGKRIEVKYTEQGSKIVFTRDSEGRAIAIEERVNGTKLYHISSDSSGLPSSHEIKDDQNEIVYFYDVVGKLQHFVELKNNGDRISTILDINLMYSIEQKQLGGIVFKAWKVTPEETFEGMVWLHQDGEVTEYGTEDVIADIYAKFSRFLDGARVKS